MQHGSLKGTTNIGNNKISMEVDVLFFEEESVHFAFLPSFDLTGYGSSDEDARDSLKIVLDEFLKYTINKNTFFIELRRLGWTIRSRKKPFLAPKISELIVTNDEVRDIVNSKQYRKGNFQVNVPAYA